VRVPGELSVVGFDDVDIAAHAGLTTVRQPLVESGRQAARIVEAERVDPDRPAEQHVLEVNLVPRGTTAQPIERGR
jgi:DNA-binding LacI/PurR family transcriptional regulator